MVGGVRKTRWVGSGKQCVISKSGLIFLIVAAWRKDRTGRSQRAPEILSLSLGSTADEDISFSIRELCRYGRFPFLFG